MARPRRQGDETALFVRIPSAEADKLHRAANALGAPKRELITRLVAQYVDPENPATLSRLGGGGRGGRGGRGLFPPAEGTPVPNPGAPAGVAPGGEENIGALVEG